MPFFIYTAKNKLGETVKNKVEAADLKQAVKLLQERELLVIEVKPITESSLASIRHLFQGVKQDDVVNLTRQLATMISAGLPITSALSILVQQSKPEVSRMVARILQIVEGGEPFSKALEKFPKTFPRIYVQLVRAGEASGALDVVLERLADNLEKSKEFRSKTKGAMIYPAIITIAMVVVGFIMMIFVVPKLTAMYDDFGAELPFMTQVLVNLSDFMVRTWWLLLTAIGGAIYGIKRWKKTKTGDRKISRFLLKLPVIGVLLQKMMLTEFARTLALLLSAGVPLLESLDIVTEGMDNIVYREALKEVTSKVEKGMPLSEALSLYEEFPPILYQMVSVGEETGKLDEVLAKLADYFEMESGQSVKNLTAAMEPLIMIILGVGVGLMVVAIIMPIYNLTGQF